MKKLIVVLLAVLMFASAPVMAGGGSGYGYNESQQTQQKGSSYNNGNGYQVDPNDQAVVTLLWLVMSDLQMCRRSMTDSVLDNVSAIGHLNNAQSALKKSQIDPAYMSLISEVDKRISKIKFYLVMNERRAANERLNQLAAVIRSVIGGGQLPGNVGGNYNGYNPGNYNYNNGNSGYGNVNSSGFVPVRPEIPVNSGQMSPNPMPAMPSGVVPVR